MIPDFNEVATPVSPGLVLMDVSTTAIERPGTPSDLTIALSSTLSDLATDPDGIAVEFAPYWLFAGDDVSWRDDLKRGVLNSILRAWSVTTAKAELGTQASPITGISLGFRVTPLSGGIDPAVRSILENVEKRLQDQAVYDRAFEAEFTADISKRVQSAQMELTAARDRGAEPEQIQEAEKQRDDLVEELKGAKREFGNLNEDEKKKLFKELREDNADLFDRIVGHVMSDDEYKEASAEIGRLPITRRGFVLEFAGAAFWDFPGKRADEGKIAKWGFWATPAWKWNRWSVVGVGRYLAEERFENANSLEVGGRVIFATGRVAFSAEYLSTAWDQDDTDDRLRAVGIVSYRISDKVWFNAGYGRDNRQRDADHLLTFFGVDVNFTGQRLQPSLNESLRGTFGIEEGGQDDF
jgi:hypothetical protein